jgi:hypothetical protein
MPVGLKNLDHVVAPSHVDDHAARRYSCQAAEHVGSLDTGIAGTRDFAAFEPSQWWSLAPRSDERTLGAVVGRILGKDAREMSLVEDQQTVQALVADSADPSFGVGIRRRSPGWAAQYLDSGVGEDRVEARTP